LEVTATQLELFDSDLRASSGLPLTDYEILVMLSESPGQAVRMSELAEKVIVSRSRLTYRVDRLAELGLVERVEVANDRRGVLAKITESGTAALVAAAPGHVEKARELIFDCITTDELETLGSILEKFAAAYERPS